MSKISIYSSPQSDVFANLPMEDTCLSPGIVQSTAGNDILDSDVEEGGSF